VPVAHAAIVTGAIDVKNSPYVDIIFVAVGGDVSLNNIKYRKSSLPWPADGMFFRGAPQSIIGGDLTCKNVHQLDTWIVSGNTAGGTDSCQPG
jgi:hypothetical protein